MSLDLWVEELANPRYFRDSARKIELQVEGRVLIIRDNDVSEGACHVPVKTRDEIARVSQLGLKEIWLGQTAGNHNRWDHSTGVFTAGHIWLTVLKDCDRVPSQCLIHPLRSWEEISAFVGCALLLHDYGHLPFSHLLDEVLGGINWLPKSSFGGGLETAVVRDRLQTLEATWTELGSRFGLSQGVACSIVEQLIMGDFGVPWLQAVVNSPIDADKIDYIQFDNQLLQRSNWPIRTRIQQNTGTEKPQWLEEFLQNQTVNHAGLLCLHGRSARAAADLWRDRVFLYDRFYLAPELRVPERIAAEIIQQFLIRSTMSREFRLFCRDRFKIEGDAFLSTRSDQVADPISDKFEIARQTMTALLGMTGGPDREFPVLRAMAQSLIDFGSVDTRFSEFLAQCLAILTGLYNHMPGQSGSSHSLREVVERCLVREPLVLRRDDAERVREVLRPLQHTYCSEVLIDVVELPRVLSAPRRWKTGTPDRAAKEADHSILVPSGPVAAWGPGSRACQPLTDGCVEALERPYCRVLIISPTRSDSAEARYIFDRVRAVLIEAGVPLVQEVKDSG